MRLEAAYIANLSDDTGRVFYSGAEIEISVIGMILNYWAMAFSNFLTCFSIVRITATETAIAWLK